MSAFVSIKFLMSSLDWKLYVKMSGGRTEGFCPIGSISVSLTHGSSSAAERYLVTMATISAEGLKWPSPSPVHLAAELII